MNTQNYAYTPYLQTACWPAVLPIELRVASLKDWETLADLGTRMLPAAHPGVLPPADMEKALSNLFSYSTLKRQIQNPFSRYWLAESGIHTAGMVRTSSQASPINGLGKLPIELAHLYLNPDWVGRGVGRTLMEHALDHAYASGHDICWLLVWERNLHAQAFYRRWGFVQVGEDVQHVGQSAIKMKVMAKNLNTLTNFYSKGETK